MSSPKTSLPPNLARIVEKFKRRSDPKKRYEQLLWYGKKLEAMPETGKAEGHKHYELNHPHPNHHHHMVCIQCNRTTEFKNDSILKHSLKQCEKEGFQLIDCQLTVMTICPEAIRMGWPSSLPSNWVCTRMISDEHSHDSVDNE